VSRGTIRAICEVRQFESTVIRDAMPEGGGVRSLSAKQVYGPLRSGIFEKAKQLRPFAGMGLPLVIVLANPLNADVTLDPHHMVAAMFGNPAVSIPIDLRTGASVPSSEPALTMQDYGVFRSPQHGPDGSVTWFDRHPHVSAVAVVNERAHADDWRESIIARHRTPDADLPVAREALLRALNEIDARTANGEVPVGSYRWITVYETDGEEAAPLPRDWFAESRDRRFAFGAEGSYSEVTL
jgi:hypothetical protein